MTRQLHRWFLVCQGTSPKVSRHADFLILSVPGPQSTCLTCPCKGSSPAQSHKRSTQSLQLAQVQPGSHVWIAETKCVFKKKNLLPGERTRCLGHCPPASPVTFTCLLCGGIFFERFPTPGSYDKVSAGEGGGEKGGGRREGTKLVCETSS